MGVLTGNTLGTIGTFGTLYYFFWKKHQEMQLQAAINYGICKISAVMHSDYFVRR